MNTYWKQISSVFSGAIISQIVPLVGSLLITRMFSPTHFGEFATWLASLSILSIIITFRLETSFVIIPDGKRRENAVLITLFLMNSFVACLLLFIALISLLNIVSYSFIFFTTIIIGAGIIANNTIWQSWIIANGEYSTLIKVRILQSVSVLFGQILFGLFSPTMLSLSLGFITGNLITLLFAYKKSPLSLSFSSIPVLKKKINIFIRRYKYFIIYGLPADFFNTLVSQLPIIIISYRFGADIAGFLSLTTRVLGMPIKLIGSAVLDVFKRHAAQDYIHIGNCKKIYLQTFIILLIASTGLILGTIFLAKPIFSFVYGSSWEFSGEIAIWLLPMFALGFIASPLSYLAYIAEKQYIDLIWQVMLFIITMSSLIIFNNFKDSIIYYSASYAVLYLIYILISYKLSLGIDHARIKK